MILPTYLLVSKKCTGLEVIIIIIMMHRTYVVIAYIYIFIYFISQTAMILLFIEYLYFFIASAEFSEFSSATLIFFYLKECMQPMFTFLVKEMRRC